MAGPRRIEAYAIVSEDGMLADASGRIPPALQVEADQKFFHGALEQAAVVVHGKHSHEGGPKAAGRRRLVLTRQVPSLAPEPDYPLALRWNPQGASLQEAWQALDAPDGLLAVIGGPEVYQLFLDIGYDAFHLSRVPGVRLPGGRPVFPEIGPQRSPEDVLANHGLHPGPRRVLDPAARVTLVSWTRTGRD